MTGDGEADRELTELIDDARHRDAVASRSRQRWLRQQAEESATLAGLFAEAMSNRAQLSVRTTAGRLHHGTVAALGQDFLAMRTEGGLVAIPLHAVTIVRVDPTLPSNAPATTGAGDDVLFTEMLADSLEGQPRVGVIAGGDPEVVVGKLRSVGADVMTVAVETRLVYVSLSTVSEVSFFTSA